MSIESQVCDAVEIIVDNKINKANYDRTIQATVVKCIDATIGKYLVKYQDSTFNAYASGSGVSYPDGTGVYILIPGNDMNGDKTILGASEKTAVNYIEPEPGEDAYTIVGEEFIYNSEHQLGLCSKWSEKVLLYSQDMEAPLFAIDKEKIERYIQRSDSIVCGAKFKTKLDPGQQMNGNYGIVFSLNFKNNASGALVTRDYVVDVNNMVGNPYRLQIDMRQSDIFEVDGANFDSINSIYLFVENFPNQFLEKPENKPYDIFVKDIEFCGALALTTEELEGYALSLETPQGFYFHDQDTESEETKTVVATLKMKGLPIDADSQNVSFYWFIENVRVTQSHEGYNPIGGIGWRCLNDYNEVPMTDGTSFTTREWIPMSNTIIVSDTKLIAYENKVKCVAVHEGNTVSKEVTIMNLNSGALRITLESDLGTNFYYDNGAPTLTCIVYDRDQGTIQDVENYEYGWTVEDNYGHIKTLTSVNEEGVEQAHNTHSYKVNIPNIDDFSIFRCSVFGKDGDSYFGTASIKISNRLIIEGEYSLLINGGSQVFVYNENGVSPTSKSVENPIELETLSFTLFDGAGNQVSEEALINSDVRWLVPINDTMIIPPTIEGNGDLDPLGEYRVYTKVTSLNFDITSHFNPAGINSQIKLVITYKDLNLTAETNFGFMKQGDPGTNGTEYACRIIPNSEESTVPEYITITHNESTGESYFNFRNNLPIYAYNNMELPDAQSQYCANPFQVQLWKNGECIFESAKSGYAHSPKSDENGYEISDDYVSVTWDIFKNRYCNNIEDNSNLYWADRKTDETQTNGMPIYDHCLYYNPGSFNNKIEIDGKEVEQPEAPANTIRATLEYQGQIFYATLPIATITIPNKNYIVEIPNRTGFRTAIYTSSGVAPRSAQKPFEIKVYYQGSEVQYEKDQFTWGSVGTVKYRQDEQAYVEERIALEKISSYLATEDAENQQEYTLVDEYNGLCITNAVTAAIKGQLEDELIHVHIPIYFYLNKHGLANVNAWDGNSVQVDEEGGFVLAPQIGAGVKDDHNAFTGLIMGQVLEPGRKNADIGLLGYSHGLRTIFLDSETGAAQLGSKDGQLAIDPSSGRALLYSKTYWKNYNEKGYPILGDNESQEEANVNRLIYNPVAYEENETYGNKEYYIKTIEGNTVYYDKIIFPLKDPNTNKQYYYLVQPNGKDNPQAKLYQYVLKETGTYLYDSKRNDYLIAKDNLYGKQQIESGNPYILLANTSSNTVLVNDITYLKLINPKGAEILNEDGTRTTVTDFTNLQPDAQYYLDVEGVMVNLYAEQDDENNYYLTYYYAFYGIERYDLNEIGLLYSKEDGTGKGMLIDLSSPQIDFASKYFSVDPEGKMTATAGTIGGWEITRNSIRSIKTNDQGLAISELKSNGYIRLGYLGGKGIVEIAGFNIESKATVHMQTAFGTDGVTDTGESLQVNSTIQNNGEPEDANSGEPVTDGKNAVATESSNNAIEINYSIFNTENVIGNQLYFLYNGMGMQLLSGKNNNNNQKVTVLSPYPNPEDVLKDTKLKETTGYLSHWQLVNIPKIYAEEIYQYYKTANGVKEYDKVASERWVTSTIATVKDSLLRSINNIATKYSKHAHSWTFRITDSGNVTGTMHSGGANGSRTANFDLTKTAFYRAHAYNNMRYSQQKNTSITHTYYFLGMREKKKNFYFYAYALDGSRLSPGLDVEINATEVYLQGVKDGAAAAAGGTVAP